MGASSTLSLQTTGGTASVPIQFTTPLTLAAGTTVTNASGDNALLGNMTVNGNSTISSGANLLYVGVGTVGVNNPSNYSSTITLSNSSTLTFNATAAATTAPNFQLNVNQTAYDNTDMLVNSVIGGTGNVAYTGTGTITIGNASPSNNITLDANSYSGTTSITLDGTVIVDSAQSTVGIPGAVTIGTSGQTYSNPTSTLQIGDIANGVGNNYNIGTVNTTDFSSNVNMTINGNGVFNMNGSAQGLNTLTLNGGTGAAEFRHRLPGLVVFSGVTTGGTAQTSTIESGNPSSPGYFQMLGNGFTFNVANGSR